MPQKYKVYLSAIKILHFVRTAKEKKTNIVSDPLWSCDFTWQHISGAENLFYFQFKIDQSKQVSQEKEGNHWFALPYQRMNKTAVCGQEMDQIQNNSADSMIVKIKTENLR